MGMWDQRSGRWVGVRYSAASLIWKHLYRRLPILRGEGRAD
jgi:hypothetical protein